MSKTKPIPSYAKMVFKGKLFEVWQWEQKMFDGTLSHREFLNVLDVAVTRHIARACSEIAVSRRDALLELEASL